MRRRDRRGKGQNESRALISLRRRRDPTLKQQIARLTDYKRGMGKLDDWIRKDLHLPGDRSKGIFARVVRSIVPRSLFDRLPEGLIDAIGEEEDVLQYIEKRMRGGIDGTQEALRGLSEDAVEYREEILNLREQIRQAETEKWDLQRLHQFLADRSEIDVDPEIMMLLDAQLDILTEEERETRRQELIEELKATVDLSEGVARTMGEVCYAALEVFQKAVSQYHQFTTVHQPIAAIRDTAKELLDTDQSLYAAKDAIVATIQLSLEAVTVALEGAKMVDQYRIASADVKGLLEAGKRKLEHARRALPPASPRMRSLAAPKDEEGEPPEETGETESEL